MYVFLGLCSDSEQAAALKMEEADFRRTVEEGRANRKKAAEYLKETIKRMRRHESEKEQQNEELLKKRTQAVESLKSNIAATHESLRKQQKRAEERRRRHRESLEAQGINGVKHMYHQKQREEIKHKQAEFEERQKLKRGEIAAKLLQEERLLKSRKRQRQALLAKHSTGVKFPALERARETLLLRYLEPSSPPPPPAGEERAAVRRLSGLSRSSSASSDVEGLEEEAADQEVEQQSLAEPEFSGLWDQNDKKRLSVKAPSVQTEVKREAPEVTFPAKKVHGKELKGPPFISKPKVILFKDFDVGTVYKKKIVLTNVSYVTNHCKLLGVSANLKHILSVR
ncbi:Cilia- and flagella-associated protein 74 [Liparis tanakae]|uniref:Cilia-and flagella-associated protein 74 n=1 Tax=Liparis tanakae TaxID=230148 RepID=A0A4Z2EZA5_9TELE|nr:Cilia- and flagella-associated protein 74 [Liparis tanakae]